MVVLVAVGYVRVVGGPVGWAGGFVPAGVAGDGVLGFWGYPPDHSHAGQEQEHSGGKDSH